MSGKGTSDESSDKAGRKVPGKESLKPQLPKRFYKDVAVGPGPDYRVLLDGRAIKTPRKRELALPAAALGEAVAAEWRAQRLTIDPATMPLTRIANTAIDAVADQKAEVAADIAAFAGCDLLCYRAEGPAELVARQASAWDPTVTWAERALGTRIWIAAGINPIEQAASLGDGVLGLLAGVHPLRLSALHVITTLTGSAFLALAHDAGELAREDAWYAAHVDEDWQIEQWGDDAEATVRRAFRRAEFDAACQILHVLGNARG